MSQTALYLLYAFLVLGAAGLYLILPRTRPDARRLRSAGTLIGAAALIGVVAYLLRWMGPAFEGRAFFIIFAVMAVAGAVRVITHPKPVYSAVYFILVVLASTGLCFLAAAEFLGAALLIIYGGAILVTYIFVIMLAQQAGQSAYDREAREPFAAVLVGFLLLAATGQALAARDPIAQEAARSRGHSYRYVLARASEGEARPVADPADNDQAAAAEADQSAHDPGNTREVGSVLTTAYAVAVELAGVLLLVAVVGAIAIARKRIEPEAMTPEERRQLEEKEDLHQRGRQAAPF